MLAAAAGDARGAHGARADRPLHPHTETLTGNLDLRTAWTWGARDELRRLAESFNGTLEALERSVQAQRHLIADASHELRTPISSLRANIQILGEAERLARMSWLACAGHRGGARRADGAWWVTWSSWPAEPHPRMAADDVRLDEVVHGSGASAPSAAAICISS